MNRAVAPALTLLAACRLAGCAPSAERASERGEVQSLSPHAHRQLAAIAGDAVVGVRKRLEADEPLTPEFATGTPDQTALAEHRRRMRHLHARLSRLCDERGGVSRIEVSQSAYFLREAERRVR